MWKCRKCGLERVRRQGSEYENGGKHDWGDRDEVDEYGISRLPDTKTEETQ
jgi:hypothetical protein